MLPEVISTAQMVSGLTRRTRAGVLTGLRMSFRDREGLVTMLSELAGAEHAACSGLKFNLCLPPHGGMITLEMTGPEGTHEMLLQLIGSD